MSKIGSFLSRAASATDTPTFDTAYTTCPGATRPGAERRPAGGARRIAPEPHREANNPPGATRPGASCWKRVCDTTHRPAAAARRRAPEPQHAAKTSPPKRFASVWLPLFAIDRLRRATLRTAADGTVTTGVPYDRPFVLARSGGHGLTITAANECATAEGLVIGQSLADARAALPALLTRPGEPEQDDKHLHALCYAAGRYGPARNCEGADGFWIDITGVAHLFGGEIGLTRDLLERLARAGFRAQVAIADTPAAAFALARYAVPATPDRWPVTIAQAGQTAQALKALPVAALRLDADTVTLLKRLGLRSIGQLYGMPRSTLARRFRDLRHKRAGRAATREGVAQAVVTRLDQALGQLADPRLPVAEPPVFIARRSYPDILITSEGIETACRELASELCVAMASADKGARRLRFALYRADGGIADAVIGTSRPCRAPDHLIGLFRDKLERLDAGFGIDMITLEALQVEPVGPMQEHLAGHPGAGSGHSSTTAGALADRLINRLGRNVVFRLEDAASHIPERAQIRVTDFRHDLECRQGVAFSRPPFLLAEPEPITVIAEVPEGAPRRFTWRRVMHRIVKVEGPERIAPEWWCWLRQVSHLECGHGEGPSNALIRDYYRLEDNHGAAYWVFRAGLYGHECNSPAWFMHGLYG